MSDRGSGSDQTVLVGTRVLQTRKQDLDVEGNGSEGSEGGAKLWAGETGDRLATCTSKAASRSKRLSLLPEPLGGRPQLSTTPHLTKDTSS